MTLPPVSDGVFLEVILRAADAAAMGIESRDEVEDALEEELASGVGEVTGGGGGSGVYVIDIEIATDRVFDEALVAIRGVLQGLQVPPSTVIKRRGPAELVFPVYT